MHACMQSASSASSASQGEGGSGLWHHLSVPFSQWKAAASAKLSNLLAQPRYPSRIAASATSAAASSAIPLSVPAANGLARSLGAGHSLTETYQAMQAHWEALRLTLQREGLAGGAATKDLYGRSGSPMRNFEDSQVQAVCST